MDKQTEIAKLRRLLTLRREHANLSRQIQNAMQEKCDCDKICSEKIAARAKEIENLLAAKCPDFDRKCNAPAVYSHTGRIPPEKPAGAKPSVKFIITLAVSAILTLSFFAILFQALIGQLEVNIWVVLLFIAGGPALGVLCVHLYQLIRKPKQVAYKKRYGEYLAAEKELDKLQSTYRTEAQNSTNGYLESIEAYEEQYKKAVVQRMRALSLYQKAMDDLPQFKAKCSAESEHKKKECDQRIETAQRQLAVCNQEIEQLDVLHPSYWDYLSDVITLLETGRADTCKEALNIAIEQEEQRKHQERMEEIARERARIEARRAEEERRHNQEMAQQAEDARIRAEVDAKLQADRERAAAEKSAKDQAAAAKQAADKAERERNLAGFRKCINCANKSKCSIYVQENGGGLTCGAYRPR